MVLKLMKAKGKEKTLKQQEEFDKLRGVKWRWH